MLHSNQHTILKKIGGKADNSLILEKIAELVMQLESLQVEGEVLRRQKEPMVEEQQGSGLKSETRNFPHDERGTQTELEGRLPPYSAPSTFTAWCPEHLHGTRDQEEQETIQRQQDTVQPSAPPEDLLGLHRHLLPVY